MLVAEPSGARRAACTDAPGWQRACRRLIDAERGDGAVLRLLEAFSPPGDGSPGARFFPEAHDPERFDRWEAAALGAVEPLVGAILSCPAPKPPHPPEQARRFRALVAGLSSMRSPEARVLRLGLLARTAGALDRAERRYAAIRDVLDFYYGHASVLLHRRAGLPSPGDLARAAAWRAIAPGIEHATLSGITSRGPLHASLLRARGARLDAFHRTSAEIPFDALVQAAGAAAGISGGYVLCSDMDIEPPSAYADPVGLLVESGRVVSPPVLRRACLLDGPGGVAIRVVGPVGLRITLPGGASQVVRAHNDASAVSRVPTSHNRASGAISPPHGGVSIALLGRRVIRAARGPLPIPKAGVVVSLPPASEPEERAWLSASSVDLALAEPVHAAVAGGPLLVDGAPREIDLAAEELVPAAPPFTFAADETQGQGLLPRMVAGLAPDGALLIAAIDGRDFERSVGMTLQDCADLLRSLGCKIGMNLDGGDSKRMVVEGRVVDRPGRQLEWPGPAAAAHADQPAALRSVHTGVLLSPAWGRP